MPSDQLFRPRTSKRILVDKADELRRHAERNERLARLVLLSQAAGAACLLLGPAGEGVLSIALPATLALVALVALLPVPVLRAVRAPTSVAFPVLLGAYLCMTAGFLSAGPAWILSGAVAATAFLDGPALLAAGLAGLGGAAYLTGAAFGEKTGVPPLSAQAFPGLAAWGGTALAAAAAVLAGPVARARLLSALREEGRLREAAAEERAALRKAQEDQARDLRICKSMREALRLRAEKLLGILSHSEDIAAVMDGRGVIVFASGNAERALGWTAEELVGFELQELLHADERSRILAHFQELVGRNGGAMESCFRLRGRDGGYINVEARIANRIGDPAVAGIVANIRDVTRLRSAEERLLFFERYDPLTELPNRGFFASRLAQEIERAKSKNRVFAVLAIGLDRFKRINDFYGTETGDAVLKEAAKGLTSAFRSGDLVCRLRGDKFLALMSDMKDADDVPSLAAKARSAVAKAYPVPDGSVDVGCTIGAALFPNDGRTPEELIKNAETAMYMAKDAGRGSWRLFDPGMNETLIARQKLEDELCRAVDSGDFVAWYQPKIDRSGCVWGMEALVRWADADGSLRMPGTFIPAAERTGAIVPIGKAMLDAACSQVLAWKSAGYDCGPISVNLSPFQFKQADLVPTIARIVKSRGVDPKSIELEFTESGLLADEQDGIRKLRELRDMGFSLSIDDFGTGYSSFSKLKDFPIDKVKIDKSFIDPLPSDPKAGTIARAIIDLAHSLDCAVVAEGVETEEQKEFLEASGCDYFQGYLFSKPLRSDAATAFLKDGRKAEKTEAAVVR